MQLATLYSLPYPNYSPVIITPVYVSTPGAHSSQATSRSIDTFPTKPTTAVILRNHQAPQFIQLLLRVGYNELIKSTLKSQTTLHFQPPLALLTQAYSRNFTRQAGDTRVLTGDSRKKNTVKSLSLGLGFSLINHLSDISCV